MTDLREKLEELQKLCDGATAHYCEFTTVNNSEFYEAARRHMPLLIEVARAAEELSEILLCSDARKEVDQFTGQPLRIAIAELENL